MCVTSVCWAISGKRALVCKREAQYLDNLRRMLRRTHTLIFFILEIPLVPTIPFIPDNYEPRKKDAMSLESESIVSWSIPVLTPPPSG